MDYSAYRELKIRRLEPGVLEIVMGEEGGKLPVATARMHAELARIWLDVDLDRDVRVAILRGAGKGFSAGGDLAMVEEMTRDFAVRARVWREARDLVYNLINCSKMVVSAMHGPALDQVLAQQLAADGRPDVRRLARARSARLYRPRSEGRRRFAPREEKAQLPGSGLASRRCFSGSGPSISA